MTSWRNCATSLTLVAEVNARWPARDKASDGTIGDVAHQKAGTSDHLPNAQGVVRARDVDKDGIDAASLAEYLRGLGASGDRRLRDGGYVIFNRRITTPDFAGWRVYTGVNPHEKHVHVSFTRDPSGFDLPGGWGIYPPPRPPAPPIPTRPASSGVTLSPGMTHPDVRRLQSILTTHYPSYARWSPITDYFGPQTAAAVREFQHRSGLTPDGIVGPVTRRALGL